MCTKTPLNKASNLFGWRELHYNSPGRLSLEQQQRKCYIYVFSQYVFETVLGEWTMLWGKREQGINVYSVGGAMLWLSLSGRSTKLSLQTKLSIECTSVGLTHACPV